MTIPDTMTAIAIQAHGGPEMLRPQQRPVPRPRAGEALLLVAGTCGNRP